MFPELFKFQVRQEDVVETSPGEYQLVNPAKLARGRISSQHSLRPPEVTKAEIEADRERFVSVLDELPEGHVIEITADFTSLKGEWRKQTIGGNTFWIRVDDPSRGEPSSTFWRMGHIEGLPTEAQIQTRPLLRREQTQFPRPTEHPQLGVQTAKRPITFWLPVQQQPFNPQTAKPGMIWVLDERKDNLQRKLPRRGSVAHITIPKGGVYGWNGQSGYLLPGTRVRIDGVHWHGGRYTIGMVVDAPMQMPDPRYDPIDEWLEYEYPGEEYGKHAKRIWVDPYRRADGVHVEGYWRAGAEALDDLSEFRPAHSRSPGEDRVGEQGSTGEGQWAVSHSLARADWHLGADDGTGDDSGEAVSLP